jgi:hypothetical protein
MTPAQQLMHWYQSQPDQKPEVLEKINEIVKMERDFFKTVFVCGQRYGIDCVVGPFHEKGVNEFDKLPIWDSGVNNSLNG